MNKILIIYGTRKGTTAETVDVIASVLRDKFSSSVDLADSSQIRKYKERFDEYDFLIIGSSIVSGRWKSKVLSFAKKKFLAGKKVAVFVTAGGTLNKVAKYGYTKEAAVKEAIEKYIGKYEKKFKFTPVLKGAFGGKVIKKGKEKYNSWNREDIENWATGLGEILTRKQM